MALTDFHELRSLRGTNSEAATTCLVRYFQILKVVKPELRSRLTEEDQEELGDAIQNLYRRSPIPSDTQAVIEAIANSVSQECGVKLRAMTFVERVVFLDAIERTACVPRKVAKFADDRVNLMH